MERGRRLDVAWEAAAPALSPGDRRWVQEAAFGVVRLRGRLDHLLDVHLDRGIGGAPPELLAVLRLGAYQLLCMDGVPRYAAVSQAVSQARRAVGPHVAGLVNAVLRALARAGGGIERFPDWEEDPEGHLATWGSHPRWLVRRWLRRFGPAATRRLVAANNRVPRLHLRPVGPTLAEAVALLRSVGIAAAPGPRGSGTVRLAGGASPSEALRAVPAVVQDPAAAWVVAWTGEVRGQRLVDLCAAPGGKATGLSAAGARVVAADRSRARLRRVRENAGRLELSLPAVVADGAAPPFRPVDVVLVDAPCSGTGTLARHPDARWRLEPADIAVLAALQDRILDGAAGMVRPGGLLVYSTCTLEPEENEERVGAFLRRHREFILEGGRALPGRVRDGAFLRVLPHRTGTDGSFAARLRRSGGDEENGGQTLETRG